MKFGLREMIFVGLLMLIPVGAWWFVFRPQNTENAIAARVVHMIVYPNPKISKLPATALGAAAAWGPVNMESM